MKPTAVRLLVVAALMAGALPSARAADVIPVPVQTVIVSFQNPDGYFDAGSPGTQRNGNLMQIADYLQKLGSRLPVGRQLHIDVLAVDLAGQIEPWRNPDQYEIRYMRDDTWPSMKLHYRLTQGDQTLAEGDESLADLDYLRNARGAGADSSLYYDKRMLETWFDKRFLAGAASGN